MPKPSTKTGGPTRQCNVPGEVLQGLRASCGLTQAELAAEIGNGVTVKILADWENERSHPSGGRLENLIVALYKHKASYKVLRAAGFAEELLSRLGIQPDKPTIELRFVTNRLENDEFLVTHAPWPFATNPRGEDISSKHTPQSKRRGLTPFRAFTSDYPVIAANELIIDFHLYNPSDTPLFLERLYLDVEDVYHVTPCMHWNTWLPVLDPHRYEIVLDPGQRCYELDFKGLLYKITPPDPEHFRLEIRGLPTCAERIFQFSLGATAHDKDGSKHEVRSDRIYHLAFSSENFSCRSIRERS